MKQLGFDLEYADPHTGKPVPWQKYEPFLVNAIRQAPWKVVDVETSGLTVASKEQNFSGKQLRAGCDPELRCRVVTIGFPSGNGFSVVSFDLDALTDREKTLVCDSSLTGYFFGWNNGFDAYWLRGYSDVTPTAVLDCMLLARLLRPDIPVMLAHMANDEDLGYDLQRAAENVFMSKRSGWSLADSTLALFHKVLSKDKQGPKNWCAPFLSQENYDYAVGDVVNTLNVLLKVFNLEEKDAWGNKVIDRYLELRNQMPIVARLEPQVWDVVCMRERGMPWDMQVADGYQKACRRKVRRYAKLLVANEEKLRGKDAQLRKYLLHLCDMGEGITAKLKEALGSAFRDVGIAVELTEKTGAFKIGEKDLRKAKAGLSGDAKRLFEPWVRLTKAKKAGNMNKEVGMFASRSPDLRIHSLIGFGPVTGRLSSAEPNVQQFPRDQGFRNAVKARKGHSIGAFDYSALDMRVGAALAIRAQEQIWDVFEGKRKVAADVHLIIIRVLSGKETLERAIAVEKEAVAQFEQQKEILREQGFESVDRKTFWPKYRELARKALLSRFARTLCYCMKQASERGEKTWGMLRDAFNIPGMDIHSWTALGMIGENPTEMFSGLSNEEIAVALKAAKKRLGDKRQTGKVGNLSLLYAMQVLGLLDAAAKVYNIHWTFEEGAKVRSDWFATYVEIDLWHAWTELNAVDKVYLPDPEKGGRYGKKDVYGSITLGDRLIYAFGLNAALSYEDQSTGADILALVMHRLATEQPVIFACMINQVHDEVVFELPDEHVADYSKTIRQIMVECSEEFLMLYGVKGACSAEIGKNWLKG